MRKYNVFVLIAVVVLGIFASCQVPSPLTGSWSDNAGNKLQIISDGSFTATVGGENFDGTYNVLLNAIVFKTSDNTTKVSEWDIRGNMLYLSWNVENGHTNLTLFKTSN